MREVEQTRAAVERVRRELLWERRRPKEGDLNGDQRLVLTQFAPPCHEKVGLKLRRL